MLSKGNPIEDAKALFAQVREAGFERHRGLALTGYGKDLLKDILGADVAVVETVAHATAALHFFPDADVICDVGGTDVKIMILRQGTVADFRLNSQCSSGNGAFLQGVAERYDVPLEDYAEQGVRGRGDADARDGLRRVPAVRHRQPAAQGLVGRRDHGVARRGAAASTCGSTPASCRTWRAAGRKFVLQGGTHRNLAVVKAQVDFIRGKVPGRRDRGASLLGRGGRDRRGAVRRRLAPAAADAEPLPRFRHDRALTYTSTTSDETVCHWCPVNCKRTFIDVQLPGAHGPAVEQGAAGAGLGARDQRQHLPEGPGRGRQRDAGGEGASWRRSSVRIPTLPRWFATDAFRRTRAESGPRG